MGGNEKAISTVDELGVALAAIQELNKELKAVRAQTMSLENRIAGQQELMVTLVQQ